jgi:hypothetical protein
MFFQAIKGEGLETLKDFCVGSFDLSIVFCVSNRCIANLDAQFFTLFLEGTAGKLGPVMILFGTPNKQTIDLMNLTADCLLIFVIPRSEKEGMKPPYVCPGCSNHTYSNNMITRIHVQ